MQILKTIFKKNALILRLVALTLCVLCAVTILSQAVMAKNTYVITDGEQVIVHTTYETNPEAVLDEAGLQLGEVDTYITLTGADVNEITVRRGMKVTVDNCGEVIEVVSYGETVGELFKRLDVFVQPQSDVSHPMDMALTDGMLISIHTTVESNDSYTVAIPFEIEYKQTDLLPEGKQVVLTEGVEGQRHRTARVTYVDGKETERELLTDEIITEPVTKVIAVGTGNGKPTGTQPIIGDGVIITPTGEVLTYTHVDTYKATSYCRTCEGGEWTSTGTPTRVGVVAVDPRYIPYGTRMFIVTKDGAYVYGVSTAEDCGGDIKKKRLDLFYETREEALAFGVRDCWVYFLG
jgi:uncharacterized protein YabE (DUF348 family)/3D (Asp-Asp-Asp) domain-containing protein